MKKNTTTTATKPQLRFLFCFSDGGVTYGPMFGPDALSVKYQVKANWGLKSIRGLEVWEQTEAEAEAIRKSNEQFYNSIKGKATHVCQLDFS